MLEILFYAVVFGLGYLAGAVTLIAYAAYNEPEAIVEPDPGFMIHQKLIDSSDIHDGMIGACEDREDSIEWERDEDYVELAVEYLINNGLTGCSSYPHYAGAWWSNTSNLYGEYGSQWDMEEMSAHPVGFTPAEEELIFHKVERYRERPTGRRFN